MQGTAVDALPPDGMLGTTKSHQLRAAWTPAMPYSGDAFPLLH